MSLTRTSAGSLALTLVLAAGLPASAFAADSLTVRPARGSSSLVLNGAAVHQAQGTISRHRLVPVGNSLVATWDETAAGVTTSFFAISHDGARFNQVMGTENTVALRYATFDPTKGQPAIPEALRATPGNELFIVQFISTPLDEMRAGVEALGGTIERYIAHQSHLVRIPAAEVEAVRALPYVRWVGEYHPAYRLSEEVRAQVLAGKDSNLYRYSVEVLRAGMAQQQVIADMVLAMGGVVEVVSPDLYRMEVSVRPDQILEIARRNEISYIDPWGGPMGHDMDIIRQLGGAVPILSSAGFTGQGARGEVFDGGILTNHQQWDGQAPILRNGSVGSGPAHGTACYGVCFATGTGNVLATGMLPSREQGIFCASNQATQFGGANTRLTLNTQAVNPAGGILSCFQTSSVGNTQTTAYTTISQEVDTYLFQVDYLSCQSQSNLNTQSSRPQAWAKNICAVGGIDHKNTLIKTDDSSSGASFGPAADGRMKPDLAHSYLQVFTTGNGSTTPTPTTYGEFSGTSSATPITAGHFGLVQQMWHQGVWTGHGGGSSVFASRPKSTTAKAIMINNAYRYPLNNGVGQLNLTRVRQGWGMADVGAAYNIRAKTFIVNETDALLNAQTKSYTIVVGAGEPELRVTMVYLDPPPATTSSPNTVNDLNLRVTHPNGTTIYWGNNGLLGTTANNFSTSGGFANRATNAAGAGAVRDTVECVFLQNPAAGNWTVEVLAAAITVDARSETPGVTDADYALVVTGGIPPQPPAACYANCDGSTGVPQLTANDFQCFLDKFAAGDSYANCDGSTGSPALTANDFQCFLNKFAGGCS